MKMEEKIYCSNCKYLRKYEASYICLSPDNKGNWYNETGLTLPPHKKNSFNMCNSYSLNEQKTKEERNEI